ncbi:hypothetical protein HYT56_05720, partial [Candidatus Woesearchaeota archaeon]|nr:hypothetical protein [Candidatus Woesearchaeota archaeon]
MITQKLKDFVSAMSLEGMAVASPAHPPKADPQILQGEIQTLIYNDLGREILEAR